MYKKISQNDINKFTVTLLLRDGELSFLNKINLKLEHLLIGGNSFDFKYMRP